MKAKALADQIGDKYRIGYIQSLLGRIYWHIDDFATSIDYYLSALKLVQTENHPELEISLINGLGWSNLGWKIIPKRWATSKHAWRRRLKMISPAGRMHTIISPMSCTSLAKTRKPWSTVWRVSPCLTSLRLP